MENSYRKHRKHALPSCWNLYWTFPVSKKFADHKQMLIFSSYFALSTSFLKWKIICSRFLLSLYYFKSKIPIKKCVFSEVSLSFQSTDGTDKQNPCFAFLLLLACLPFVFVSSAFFFLSNLLYSHSFLTGIQHENNKCGSL